MNESGSVSRRSFLKGAGASAIAAGLLTTVPALAEESAGASAAANAAAAAVDANECISIFGEDVNLMPGYKATWERSSGPVGFESREIGADEITRTDECELLVLGAGISGTMAALKAAEMGADVVMLEKMSRGRNTWESIGGYNSRFQKENNNVPDPGEYAEELFRAAYWRCRADVIYSFINNSGETIDFMQDMLDKTDRGIKIYNTVQGEGLFGAADINGFKTIQGEHKFEVPEVYHWDSWMLGPAVMSCLEEVIAGYSNIDLRYNTAGVQLVQDASGRVIGAIAKDRDGYYQVNASKGVVLCTGGYEANPQMIEAWCRPEDYATASCWDPCQGPTGDGHMMGLQIGAQMDPVPHCAMNFAKGSPAQWLDFPGVYMLAEFGMLTSAKGKRFANEGLQFNFLSNAINAQPNNGKGIWYIADSNMMGVCADMNPEVDKYVQSYTEKGWLKTADTIEELAGMIDIDPATLAATVAEYNSFFEREDMIDPVFRRDLSLTMPVVAGPFYALTTNSVLLTVVSGLTINENCQVLDRDENVIEGLYAAGNASGSFFSGSYPRHLPATSVGRAATFGYVSARHAIEGK